MRAPLRPPSHRRRFVIGLACALLLGVGVSLALLTAARTAERHQLASREAVVTLRALTGLIERAEAPPPAEEGGFADELAGLDTPAEEPAEEPAPDEPGEAVRRAAARFAAAHPELRSVRVVTFEGIRLEASTDPADTGARAAPRRLEREEKDVYDQGQRLRAAIDENREAVAGGGSPINPEIAVQELADGGLSIAGPVESGGATVGMVQIRTAPNPAVRPPAPAWLPALLAWLAPVALLALLGLAIGERRTVLAAAALVLLAAGLFGFSRWVLGVLEAERRETARQLAAHVNEQREIAGQLLTEIDSTGAAPLDPLRWDVDLYRVPRELVTAEGTLDEGRLGEQIRLDAGRLTRSVAVLAVLALVLLTFIGFGGAAATGRSLVRYRAAYAYTLPAILAMTLLSFFPFFYGIALSFTNANIYNSNKPITDLWVGLDNFISILSDFSIARSTADGLVINYNNFYWTLGFNVVWTIANVVIGVTLGLILALILNTRGLALRPIYRVLLILPWAVPNYITSLIFKGMFHQQFGVINQIRQIVGLEPVAWFDGPLTSFAAVLTTNGWLSFSFMMVVSLGALQSIPSDLYEAAKVDGATRWQQFLAITLPSLRPALIPAIILSVIWTFNQFNVIFLVSAGEPAGATEILITKAYRLAFEQYRYGYAAAYSMVIFLILMAYGIFQNRATQATEAIGE
ncbi:MAG TPA: sugar ABC transporter permease [Thermoanaerobaculia bacterium]|nr:sugar ABC transporter permease [Thermoanaerobaculia bacterium]